MFSLIVAYDEDRVIGYKGSIPWHLSEDLKQFKAHTINKRIVMGNNTFKSIGKPLPNRHTIIITKNKKEDTNDASYVSDLDSFLKENENTNEEIMICGGASIYKEALPYCKKLYISLVDGKHLGDTYFPDFNLNNYELVNKTKYDGFSLLEYNKNNNE